MIRPASQSQAVFLLYRRILNADDGSLSSSACLRMGLDFWRAGKANDSINAFRKALGKDGNNSQAQFALGLALLDQGQVEEAEKTYAQGVAKFGRSWAEKALAGIRDLNGKAIKFEPARDILTNLLGRTVSPEQ